MKFIWKLWALFYHFWLTLKSLNPIFWLWLSHQIILQLLTHLWLTILNYYLTLSTVTSIHHNHCGHILNGFPNCQLTHHQNQLQLTLLTCSQVWLTLVLKILLNKIFHVKTSSLTLNHKHNFFKASSSTTHSGSELMLFHT